MASDNCSSGIERMDEGFVCGVADALEQGDEVIINERARPITVLGRETQYNPGVLKTSDYPYRIVWLRGNGTEYRLRYSHLGDYYPSLQTEGNLETRESFSVRYGEVRKKTISTERGERVRRLSVVDVPDDKLSQWALVRNVDGLNDCEVDTDTERQEADEE